MTKSRRKDCWTAPWRYVTAYRVSRHYGGPEEGGWWYNWWEPLESVRLLSPVRAYQGRKWEIYPPMPVRAENIRAALAAKYAEENWGDIYSVLDGEEVRVVPEEVRFEDATKHVPHYE